MLVKLSNEKVLEKGKGLEELVKKELPVKVSYAIAKNIDKLQAIVKIFNNERQKLVEKYALKDEQGQLVPDTSGNLSIVPKHVQAWNKDMKDLLEIENEIDIHKFSIDALDGLNIAPVEMMLIDYMIEE